MIWMTDTSKRFTFLNKGWLEFRGKKGNEGSSTFDTEYIHPEDVDRVLTTFEKSFDSRVPFETEYRIKKHNGEYRWLLTSGIPRYSPGNIFLGFIGEKNLKSSSLNELQR
jgi:PAS domain S-box-containing protein